jgi:hypothetical protein
MSTTESVVGIKDVGKRTPTPSYGGDGRMAEDRCHAHAGIVVIAARTDPYESRVVARRVAHPVGKTRRTWHSHGPSPQPPCACLPEGRMNIGLLDLLVAEVALLCVLIGIAFYEFPSFLFVLRRNRP